MPETTSTQTVAAPSTPTTGTVSERVVKAKPEADAHFYGRSMPAQKPAAPKAETTTPAEASSAAVDDGGDDGDAGETGATSAPAADKAPTKPAEKAAPSAETAPDTPTAPEGDDKDPYADRFQQLVSLSKELREREGKVKQREADSAKALEALSKMDKDPVNFIFERYGEGIYQQLTDRVLGKKSGVPKEVVQHFEELKNELASVKAELAEARQQPQRTAQQDGYDKLVGGYFTMVDQEIGKHEVLGRFYSTDEVRQKIREQVMDVANKHAELLGRPLTLDESRALLSGELTPSKLVGKISRDLSSRLEKTSTGAPKKDEPTAGSSTKQVKDPNASPSGSETLTGDLGKDYAHMTPEEFALLPPRDRMRHIQRKYSG